MPKFFDIHSHLNFSDFDKDRDEVIGRALDAEIWMMNVGSDFKNSKFAVEIAEKYKEGVYASVGLHPNDNKKEIFDFDKYHQLAENQKVVAIGETGIDLFRCPKEDLFRQADIFKKHIELALELDKPLMIHCRDAHDETIKILEEYKNNKLKGNLHFFTGTLEQAKKYFELGLTVSFTGVITFARQYDEIIKYIPLDKILLETDAPYVAPLPYRGKRNEPVYIIETAKKMAEIKEVSFEKVAEQTTRNTIKVFNIC